MACCLFNLSLSGDCDGQAPLGYQWSHGKYYRLYDKEKHDKAVKQCEEDNANLAMVKDSEDSWAVEHYYSSNL